jgi:hypothetical protein
VYWEHGLRRNPAISLRGSKGGSNCGWVRSNPCAITCSVHRHRSLRPRSGSDGSCTRRILESVRCPVPSLTSARISVASHQTRQHAFARISRKAPRGESPRKPQRVRLERRSNRRPPRDHSLHASQKWPSWDNQWTVKVSQMPDIPARKVI